MNLVKWISSIRQCNYCWKIPVVVWLLCCKWIWNSSLTWSSLFICAVYSIFLGYFAVWMCSEFWRAMVRNLVLLKHNLELMNIYAISNILCDISSFRVNCTTCIHWVSNKFSCVEAKINKQIILDGFKSIRIK